MSVTIKFDGIYRNKICKVNPDDIVLQGKKLKIKGVNIPIVESRLYDVFYFLEKKTRYKHGETTLILLNNGEIKYTSNVNNSSSDYYIGKILGFGTVKTINILFRNVEKTPGDDEYLIGDYQDYW